MNLKNCVTKSEKHYTPHKLRSRPLRCLSLPIMTLFLFILFWFIMCPLIFVSLLKTHYNWPKEWPYYYWAVALIIFVILLAILVCLWRYSPHKSEESKLCKTESDLLLNNTKYRKSSKQKEVYTISLNTIQRSQDKLDAIPKENTEKQQNCVNVSNLEEKLEEKPKDDNKVQNATDKAFPRCSMRRKPEKHKNRPDSLAIPPVRETAVEVHSASSPLTPRELFFWDLIQSANKNRNSTTYNFIEHEKQYSSLDNFSLNSPMSRKSNEDVKRRPQKQTKSSTSSTEYFIANVPDRKSLATEVFLYVDGGQEEKRLQIRTNDCDDVFSH